ncbi:F-box domain-containing protein [Mycena chlorophos]|uniref:F-box domain-containing protein n=1 Tax=Mycena chlorophos TaxID=658473 RepID=A0A8H6WQG0_MYCCL|nr:F-box domain-containing protein [Mycena chlorophos]
MNFDGVPLEIIQEVFSWCDIHTVLCRLSLVSRQFRQVARRKQLWILLLRALASSGMLDLAPEEDLGQLSRHQLILKVKYIAHGPRSWGTSAVKPLLRGQETPVTLQVPTSDLPVYVQLLQGGRFLFVRVGWWQPQLVDVYERRVVWKVQEEDLIANIVAVSADGDTATIAILSSNDAGQTRFRLSEYSCKTQKITEKLTTVLSGLMPTSQSLKSSLARGQYRVFRTRSARNEVYLTVMDVVQQRFAVLRLPAPRLIQHTVSGHYLIVASFSLRFLSIEGTLRLDVYPMDSLSWTAFADAYDGPGSLVGHGLLPGSARPTRWHRHAPSTPIVGQQLLPVFTQSVPTTRLATIFLSAYLDPLHHDRHYIRIKTACEPLGDYDTAFEVARRVFGHQSSRARMSTSRSSASRLYDTQLATAAPVPTNAQRQEGYDTTPLVLPSRRPRMGTASDAELHRLDTYMFPRASLGGPSPEKSSPATALTPNDSDSPGSAESPSSTLAPSPLSPNRPKPMMFPAETAGPWYRRPWVVFTALGVLALIGVVIGAAVGETLSKRQQHESTSSSDGVAEQGQASASISFPGPSSVAGATSLSGNAIVGVGSLADASSTGFVGDGTVSLTIAPISGATSLAARRQRRAHASHRKAARLNPQF